MKAIFRFIGLSILTMTVLLSCQEKDTSGQPQIVLLSGDNLTVPAEGGIQTIQYGIVNAVDGGKLSGTFSETWITDVNTLSDSELEFNIQPCNDTVRRSGIMTLEYTWNGGSVKKQFNVIQISLKKKLEATYLTGTYYGNQYGNNGEYNYETYLSDEPVVDGKVYIGGTYYIFDMYAGAPADPSNPMPPAGTYTLGQKGATEAMTFTPEYSRGFKAIDDEEYEFNVTFAEGTLTLDVDGDNVTIEAILKDVNGEMHHVSYSGPAAYTIYEDKGSGIDDADITATYGQAELMARLDNDSMMEVMLALGDVDIAGGEASNGHLFWIDTFLPFNEDGYLTPGNYPVTNTSESGTVLEGTDMMGMYVLGSYITLYDASGNYSYVTIKSGFMDISGEMGSAQTITGEFTTEEGATLTLTYNGLLRVEGTEPFSTLTEDVVLDFEGATCTANYFGDNNYQTGGGNWQIRIHPNTDNGMKDGMFIDLVDTGCDFLSGITSGTYVTGGGLPEPGQYRYGFLNLSNGALQGTMYLGAQNDNGEYIEYAPAVGGDLIIENLGNSRYTISFDFIDDKDHHFSGTWTGVIVANDQSNFME